MTNNIELLSQDENFTIGTKSNLSQILANVVSIGTDTSNVTLSIPQDISSSYNLILPVRQGASGESLVYGADGQLKWHDPTVLKQVVSVYGSRLTGNLITAIGTHDSPTYLDAYTANITPMSENSKIFVQFKVNYKAALSASNQISFYIKKTYDDNVSIYKESLFGPYNAAGGLVGQYISNLIDEPLTTSSISYQLGYKINGNVQISDTLGILGYDTSYNNTIFLQEFEGSGSNAASVWNKGADSNGLYYNDGTVHIGSSKNSLGSQNTLGVALELSGNLVGTSATFSGEINTNVIRANEGYFSSNTLYINNRPILKEDDNGNRNINTDVIVNDTTNGLTIKATGDNGNIILDPSGTGSIQINGDLQLSGNINAGTFIGDLSGTLTGIINDINLHNTKPSSINSTKIINILSNNFNEFNKPWYMDNSYNLTTGPAHGHNSTQRFLGGVLAPNGKIIFAPLASSYIGVYDPITNTYTDGPEHYRGYAAFHGGVLAPNGKIIFVPYQSAYIGIYDPITNTYTDGPVITPTGARFFGGVLAPNGKIILIPYWDTEYIGIYDPIANTYTTGESVGLEYGGFRGGVLAPNGKIILVPNTSPNVGIYDPITDTYETAGPVNGEISGPSYGFFSGGVLAPNGKIILVPSKSPVIGIYDPITNTYTDGPAHGLLNPKFSGGVLAPNGKIFFVPSVTTHAYIYDPITNDFYVGPQHGYTGSGGAFSGGLLAPNGKIILVPKNSTHIGIIENYSYKFTLKNVSDVYTPYFNKF